MFVNKYLPYCTCIRKWLLKIPVGAKFYNYSENV